MSKEQSFFFKPQEPRSADEGIAHQGWSLNAGWLFPAAHELLVLLIARKCNAHRGWAWFPGLLGGLLREGPTAQEPRGTAQPRELLLWSCCQLGCLGALVGRRLLPPASGTGHCPGQEVAKEMFAVSLHGHFYVTFSISVNSACSAGFKGFFFLVCLYLFSSYFGRWQYHQLFNLKVFSWPSGSPDTITSS